MKNSLTRRQFLKKSSIATAATTLSLSGCGASSVLKAGSGQEFDYIIIGSGPGGGPVAINLAKAGYTVALMEAGLDIDVANKIMPSTKPVYTSPSGAPPASEHPLLSWKIFVKHYNDVLQQERNDKNVDGKGILYPRGSALGGSTVNNGGIWVYPHNSDFDDIANITNDESWRSSNMRQYFKKVERCEYAGSQDNWHGFDGYISTSLFDKKIYDYHDEIKDLAFAGSKIPNSYFKNNSGQDVNHPSVAAGETGTYHTPMSINHNDGQSTRSSVRDELMKTQAEHPDKLFIFPGSLVTKLTLEGKTATGIEYIDGVGLYKGSRLYNESDTFSTYVMKAKNEVIVSGGAYNSPQLLKLSGIGPRAELESHGIEVIHEMNGVGENLQDRYEIYVTAQLNEPMDYMADCAPGATPDPCGNAYATGEGLEPNVFDYYGPYANNFILATRIEKSSYAKDMPDLFMLGLPYPFTGYYPNHSLKWETDKWCWLILKAHNENTAGTVKLNSADPRDLPKINFNYFENGNDIEERDVNALVEGVKMARSYLDEPEAKQHIKQEVAPGPNVQTDEEIKQFIKDECWGHHASCSLKIGSDDDPMAVLDSKFKVRGLKNLRVVDASVFPKTPGFFPTVAIYMISEKASESILDDALFLENSTTAQRL